MSSVDTLSKMSHYDGRQRLRVMKLTLGLFVLFAVTGAMGQTAEGHLSFEVASVRPSGPATSKAANEVKRFAGVQVDGAQAVGLRVPLSELVRQAYALKPFQVSGPAWMSSEPYDIHAKLPDGAKPDQVPAMLRTLLSDRFQLAFHRETRDHPVYALTVGKNGLKLPAADASYDQKMVVVDGALHMDRNMTMAELCDFLGRLVDRPVVDMTGLTDTYQVVLDIPTDELKRAKIAAEGIHTGDSASDPSGDSAMFAAVQQLGLRLEPRKTAVEILVVDHAEKVPSEN
jgi:uncharacterized protein (TIGR03435 family)